MSDAEGTGANRYRSGMSGESVALSDTAGTAVLHEDAGVHGSHNTLGQGLGYAGLAEVESA